MTPLEIITIWRKGCSCAPAGHPEECHVCTLALINSLEYKLSGVAFSTFVDGAIPQKVWVDGIPFIRTTD